MGEAPNTIYLMIKQHTSTYSLFRTPTNKRKQPCHNRNLLTTIVTLRFWHFIVALQQHNSSRQLINLVCTES